jgi:hypothetical protein
MDLSLSQLRVVVHENPFARIQFPRELFRGPYDERYDGSEGRIDRIFCGNQVEVLEEEARSRKLTHYHLNQQLPQQKVEYVPFWTEILFLGV